jgi:TPR repeat protein
MKKVVLIFFLGALFSVFSWAELGNLRFTLTQARAAGDSPNFGLDALSALAEQGDPEAQTSLGAKYFAGDTPDSAEAAQLIRRAAERGVPTAREKLGLMYEEGLGVAQDYAEAAKWYRLAAEQGESYSQYGLGRLYFLGLGVSQDRGMAVKLFRQAAERGLIDARIMLGLALMFGD